MPSPRPPKRHVDALRALYASPGGIRHDAYPSAMRALLELGYVREGTSKDRPLRPIWLLTETGRELVRAIGTGEPRE